MSLRLDQIPKALAALPKLNRNDVLYTAWVQKSQQAFSKELERGNMKVQESLKLTLAGLGTLHKSILKSKQPLLSRGAFITPCVKARLEKIHAASSSIQTVVKGSSFDRSKVITQCKQLDNQRRAVVQFMKELPVALQINCIRAKTQLQSISALLQKKQQEWTIYNNGLVKLLKQIFRTFFPNKSPTPTVTKKPVPKPVSQKKEVVNRKYQVGEVVDFGNSRPKSGIWSHESIPKEWDSPDYNGRLRYEGASSSLFIIARCDYNFPAIVSLVPKLTRKDLRNKKHEYKLDLKSNVVVYPGDRVFSNVKFRSGFWGIRKWSEGLGYRYYRPSAKLEMVTL